MREHTLAPAYQALEFERREAGADRARRVKYLDARRESRYSPLPHTKKREMT